MTARAVEADPASLSALADQADAEAASLEQLALGEGDVSISLAAVDKHRARARELRFGARAAARRLERKAAGERARRLGELHAEIVAHAEKIDAGELDEALAGVWEAARRFLALASAHDAAVQEFRQRAHAEDARGTTPGGPDPANAFVGTAGDGVLAGDVTLHVIGERDAAELAVQVCSGRQAAIRAKSAAALPRHRPRFVMVGRSGAVITADSLTSGMHDDMTKGDLVALGAAHIDAWMRGQLAVTDDELEGLRRAQLATAATQRDFLSAAVAADQLAAQLAMAGA